MKTPAVAAMPTSTRPRLKVCCVVRAAFSPIERSRHGTRPVSFATVTERLLGVGGGLGMEDWVARRALRGAAGAIAGRKPARKTKRGEASLSGTSLFAMSSVYRDCVGVLGACEKR